MSDLSIITATHRARHAVVYIRQSTPTQVDHHRESTDRQYQLVERAVALGWPRSHVIVIDADLGVSGSGRTDRTGFAQLTADVALGHVGLVLGLEVSRLARNNADWYRLLDLCGVTNTLLGDADGLYHPGVFNDRLVLGLKGTMSETELHVLRARLDGGIRNKAARGELRRGLPVGYIWGEEDGEVLFHPDEAVTALLHTIFARFAELGSVRRVWLWLCSEGLRFPRPSANLQELRWVIPTYAKVHQVLTNPVYAGVYVYGKTYHEPYVDTTGRVRNRLRKRPQAEWPVFLREHHPGYIDWATFEANQQRLARNARPRPHQPGGAVREGAALLQGLATCGHCGRRLRVAYSGRTASPGYYCARSTLVNGRGLHCLRIGGRQIEAAVTAAFLAALTPAALEATLVALTQADTTHDETLAHLARAVERARYEAQRAERRYRAVDPEHRLVARGLEAEWNARLQDLATAEAAVVQRTPTRPRALSPAERAGLVALGVDLPHVWAAPTTTDRDRKELLQTLLEEVVLTVARTDAHAQVALRWRGGLVSTLEIPLSRTRPATVRTDEDTIALLRRLAVHYSDATIAGILNRQGRTTARGLSFTLNRVSSLRTHWKIPAHTPTSDTTEGEYLTVDRAARVLGLASSTLHRWLNDGFIPGEQLTPGAPWRIQLTDALRARFVEHAPDGYVPIVDAMRALSVSRQTILQRVKRGELHAIHVRCGRRKGLRIQLPTPNPSLFHPPSTT